MKIGPLDIQSSVAPAAAERKALPEPVAQAEPSARVQLSSQAAAMGGGEAGRADFDAEKVQRIAQAIREGKFKIDAEAVADRLIANAQELLPRAH
jgi:negative regulator of flagellin synthesis FlgM